MKCKVQHVNSYYYPDKKTGELKSGIILTITTIERIDKDDGNGNFSIGHPTETVFVPASLNWAPIQIKALEDKCVDLIYERPIGQRYEQLVDIVVID